MPPRTSREAREAPSFRIEDLFGFPASLTRSFHQPQTGATHPQGALPHASALIPHPPAPAWRFFSGRSVAALVYSALIDQWFNSHSRSSFFLVGFCVQKESFLLFCIFCHSLFYLFFHRIRKTVCIMYLNPNQPSPRAT